jgi:hypothetical protein
MDISDKNGTCTSQLMRMHEIKTGFIWSSTYTDQCGLWVLGAERIDIGSNESRTLRICELGCTSAILIRNVIRCVPLFGLLTSGLFSLGRSFYNSLSWGTISKRTWTWQYLWRTL